MPTIEEIKASILSEKATYESLNGLDSVSKVSTHNLWAYVVATVAAVVYKLWDVFKIEMDETIKTQKRYRLLDFRNMALDFRYGHELNSETGEYDDGNYTDEQIEVSKIVKHAAVNELEFNNRKHLFIKVAAEVNGVLAKLSDDQKLSLEQYFARVKPAGTKIVIYTADADELKLTIDFYYDPLVFDDTGVRIDGSGDTSVQDAIRAYLTDLKFNGEFIVAELTDRLQSVSGVADKEVYVRIAESNYQTPAVWQNIDANYVANSGYMTITDVNLTINFIAKNVSL